MIRYVVHPFQVGVPFSLLGMVFLAVGNSMGDFANNMAMAKKGIPGILNGVSYRHLTWAA